MEPDHKGLSQILAQTIGQVFEKAMECLPKKERANSIAPFRPSMSDSRPYKGVKQQTDKR